MLPGGAAQSADADRFHLCVQMQTQMESTAMDSLSVSGNALCLSALCLSADADTDGVHSVRVAVWRGVGRPHFFASGARGVDQHLPPRVLKRVSTLGERVSLCVGRQVSGFIANAGADLVRVFV